MFFVDDLQKEYQRLKKLGVKLTVEPTKTPGSTITRFDDTVGNLIQITQLSEQETEPRTISTRSVRE